MGLPLLFSKAQMRRIGPFFPLSRGIPRFDDRRIVSGIRLLRIGNMSRFNWLARNLIPMDSWLARMAARTPRMLVAIALANQMARTIWALMAKNEDYRVPVQVAAA